MMEYPESVLREGYAISPLRSYASFETCQRDPLYRVMLDNWAHIYLRRREARRPTGYVSSQGNVQETILKAYRRMAAEQLGGRGVSVLPGISQ